MRRSGVRSSSSPPFIPGRTRSGLFISGAGTGAPGLWQNSGCPRPAAGARKEAMINRLMPREGRFFDLFNAHATHIVEGGRALTQLFTNFEAAAAHAERIDAAEHNADKITHETISLLHKTFITPLDRDQIHQLITN